MNRIKAFITGMREFREGFSAYYPNPNDAASYDAGREWAHRLTFRMYED